MFDLCDDRNDETYHEDEDGNYENITFEPVPVNEFKFVEYGLVTPQGVLFSCDYYGHATLTKGLKDRGYLDPNSYMDYGGSIHISDYEFDFLGAGSHVTQKQLDTMFEYAMAHEIQFDFAKLEIVNEKVKNGTARNADRTSLSFV